VAIKQDPSDVKVVRVSPGLSVLRYISAGDAVTPPSVRVDLSAAEGRLDLIPAPGEAPDVLRAPGGAVVLVADAEIELTITIIRHPASNSAAVELRLEPLAPAAWSNVSDEHRGRDQAEAPIPAARLSILGHVARRGDVLVASGEWLGGPEFPARLEGIEIRWPAMPRGLSLEYSVIIGSNPLRKLRPCGVNEFAGTRGRATPIIQLTIALRGELANRYRVRAECLFLGGQMISESGPVITLTGPTGREPLVGLRLWIDAKPGVSFQEGAPSGRVASGPRVFRSAKSSHDQT
jgi:hypothetical protein